MSVTLLWNNPSPLKAVNLSGSSLTKSKPFAVVVVLMLIMCVSVTSTLLVVVHLPPNLSPVITNGLNLLDINHPPAPLTTIAILRALDLELTHDHVHDRDPVIVQLHEVLHVHVIPAHPRIRQQSRLQLMTLITVVLLLEVVPGL